MNSSKSSVTAVSHGRRWLLLVVAMVVVGFAFSFQERLVWQRLLTELAMPMGVCWIMLSILLAGSWLHQGRWQTIALACTWLVFTLAGNRWIGTSLVASLENQFVYYEPLNMEPFDVLVVMGGGTSTTKNKTPQFASGGDRVAVAAQMFHAGKVRDIVVTGNTITELVGEDALDPSEQSTELLVSLGVHPCNIQPVGGRNTFEEMQELSQALPRDQRVGIVTSAWHMTRALRLAREAGLNVVPVPVGFASPRGKWSVIDLVPCCGGFHSSSRVIKEYLGMAVGR